MNSPGGKISQATSVGSLRDYLEFLQGHRQFITWPEPVMPEPDVRNVAVAAGRDFMTQPAITLCTNVSSHPVSPHSNNSIEMLINYRTVLTFLSSEFHTLIHRGRITLNDCYTVSLIAHAVFF